MNRFAHLYFKYELFKEDGYVLLRLKFHIDTAIFLCAGSRMPVPRTFNTAAS